ncbi:MAG TPA: hypothetical protein VKM54_11860 [Myxococcota bacterium]|nr:hypothetical protein [Myxococcota bacterium]
MPERREASRIQFANLASLDGLGGFTGGGNVVFESREDAIERGGTTPWALTLWAGEYTRGAALASQSAVRFVARGQLALATHSLFLLALCELALGNLAAAREALARAAELAERLGNPPLITAMVQGLHFDHAEIRGEGYGLFVPVNERFLAEDALELRHMKAMGRAVGALLYAHTGRGEDALRALGRLLPAIERGAGWAVFYTNLIYTVIEALWILDRRDHADVLERNLREKTLAPDFRSPRTNARLALARLCALTGRVEEAREWFDKARRVVEEQGARPLRAITDFDEAWMEVRRGPAGNRERALALLDAACGPFESIGMPEWLRRADELRQQLER